MAKKRFTFADAKERIKELESTVDDLQAMLAEELNEVEEDVVEDFKKIGYGDVAFTLIGLVVGLLIGGLAF